MFRRVAAGYDYIDCLGRCLSPSHCWWWILWHATNAFTEGPLKVDVTPRENVPLFSHLIVTDWSWFWLECHEKEEGQPLCRWQAGNFCCEVAYDSIKYCLHYTNKHPLMGGQLLVWWKMRPSRWSPRVDNVVMLYGAFQWFYPVLTIGRFSCRNLGVKCTNESFKLQTFFVAPVPLQGRPQAYRHLQLGKRSEFKIAVWREKKIRTWFRTILAPTFSAKNMKNRSNNIVFSEGSIFCV